MAKFGEDDVGWKTMELTCRGVKCNYQSSLLCSDTVEMEQLSPYQWSGQIHHKCPCLALCKLTLVYIQQQAQAKKFIRCDLT